jgi:hypothetical protein
MSIKYKGTLVGLYEIVKFTKITKDSSNLHDNEEHPQHYLQGDRLKYTHTHIHTYSQIFSPLFRDKLSLLRSLVIGMFCTIPM